MKLRYGHALFAVVLVTAAPLVLSVLTHARRSESEPFLAPAKAPTRCLMPATLMRYRHMTYLKELRDKAVRFGERPPTPAARVTGLGTCKECHVNRTQFCDKCHARAGVSLDCFGCHCY